MALSLFSPKHGLYDLVVVSVVMLIAIMSIAVVDTGMESTVRPPPAASAPTVPRPPATPVQLEPVVLTFSGLTTEGASSNVDGGALPANASSVMAMLQWQDDFGNNDAFRLELLINGTVVDSQEGSTGELIAQGDAVHNGTLTAKITAVSCPGVVAVSPIDRDSGNSWQMVIEIEVGG